jgi:hypothetical protein
LNGFHGRQVKARDAGADDDVPPVITEGSKRGRREYGGIKIAINAAPFRSPVWVRALNENASSVESRTYGHRLSIK